MSKLVQQYRDLFQERDYVYHLVTGWLILITSFIVDHYAGLYATQMAGAPVSDLFLDHLPLLNVSFIHIYAALFFWLLLSLYLLGQPQWVPFVTKTAAVFIFVRSMFICLTHIGPPVNLLDIPTNAFSYLLFDGDLFFSGHVGGPFLMLLIFWRHLPLRLICLCATIFFSATVLMGHIHYSIDVFSAPFIVYGLYQYCYHHFKVERAYCQRGVL